MKVYLVGGAVRDAILQVPVQDRDWVVLGATPAMMVAQGYEALDQTFPVFLHPETREEYALARRERKAGKGYRGFELEYDPGVTLEEDLMRRDLTMNALAQDVETGELVDLFGGQADIEAGLLRHISPAFVDDPIRLLRIARFAARFGQWGFHVAHGTHGLLKKMATAADLPTVVAERVWQETRRALAEPQPQRYFQVLSRCGALPVCFPEWATWVQADGAHADAQIQPIQALTRCSQLSTDPVVRFAAWCGCLSEVQVVEACRRLTVAKPYQALAQRVVCCRARWMALAEVPSGQAVMDLLTALDAFRQPEGMPNFLMVMQALDAAAGLADEVASSKAMAFAAQFQRALGVHARDVDLTGLQGAQIAEKIKQARLQALLDAKS